MENFSNLKFIFTKNPKLRDMDVLTAGLSSYANEKKGLEPAEPFAFFLKDESEKIYGGCNGVLFYGFMYLDQLWVDQSLRGQGIGSELMKKVEEYASEKKCAMITLNTMDWEALEFYKIFGFKVDFSRTGLKNDSTLYYLSKKLMN